MSQRRLLWDLTRLGGSGPETGIRRLSRRLFEESAALLGSPPIGVRWSARSRTFLDAHGAPPAAGDTLVTPELFSERERPGIGEWLARGHIRVVGFCHDLLPLRIPECVRPHAVGRAPDHLRLLSLCDRVLAISRDTADDLQRWWAFQRPLRTPPIAVLRPGADPSGLRRGCASDPARGSSGLMIGSIEPRKRQAWIAECAARVGNPPAGAELVIAGRVNEHNGRGELRRIRAAAQESRVRIRLVDTPSEAELHRLMAEARFLIFASSGEGAGLPVGEALWAGLPCIVSDLPVHAEWGPEGCTRLRPEDADLWIQALGRAWMDSAWIGDLASAARARPLHTWRDAAIALLDEIG